MSKERGRDRTITFDINQMLYSMSSVLDMVEKELLGVTTDHSKRVAYLCIKMGKTLSYTDRQLAALACCAVMHDSALTEYLHDEQLGAGRSSDGVIDHRAHCLAGERNISVIPMDPLVKEAVLYHHEEADGGGAFGKTAAETPMPAQLIHLADQMDSAFDLAEMTEDKCDRIHAYLWDQTGILFAPEVTDLFSRSVSRGELFTLRRDRIDELLFSQLPTLYQTYSNEQLMRLATVFARIIDYKSPFTRAHSLGVAGKARCMGAYYGMDGEMQAKLFFAGAVHDVGKLAVQSDVLEKPDRLTGAEYIAVQNHAYASYLVLHRIRGLDDVAAWAYLHHEKLDGSGYPFGLKGDKLNREERLLACLDIYQALVEARPYKDGMNHEQAIHIMRDMVCRGKIDPEITEDIAECFSSMA